MKQRSEEMPLGKSYREGYTEGISVGQTGWRRSMSGHYSLMGITSCLKQYFDDREKGEGEKETIPSVEISSGGGFETGEG